MLTALPLRPARGNKKVIHTTAAETKAQSPTWRTKPSLAETHPGVAHQWHPTRNGDRAPEQYTVSSGVKVWWLCSMPCSSCGKAHAWEAQIYHRTRKGMPSGCPVCSGHSVCECSSLAALRRDQMAQWESASNKGLEPNNISLQSARKVFWVCSQHGSWRAKVQHRVNGRGCPHCAKGLRSKNYTPRGLLKDEHPKLIAQLHPSKNMHIDLHRVTSGSRKRAVWVCHDRQTAPPGCPHPHEWEAKVSDRAGLGSGCPFCSGLQVCACTSLSGKAPELAAQWHPTRNDNKQPHQYGAHSIIRVWWQHKSEMTGDVHEWKAGINWRVRVWEKEKRLTCPKCFKERRARLISRDA